MTLRHRLIAAALAAVAILILIGWHRGSERQARLCFERLAQAIADGDAGDVLGEVHADYDFRRHWPALGGDLLEGGEPRAQVLRGLLWLFQAHRDEPLSLAVDLQAITVRDDGQVEVIATLVLSSSGGLPFQIGPIQRHRFRLAREGLFALHIIDHDPISLQR